MKKYLFTLFLLINTIEVYSQANQIIIDGASSFTLLPDKIILEDSSGYPLKNFRLGEKSQIFNRFNENNVSVGFESLYKVDSNQIGGINGNTAIGSRTLTETYLSDFTTAFGYGTMQGLKMLDFNTGFGANVMVSSDMPERTTVVGSGALNLDKSSVNTSAFGSGAMAGSNPCNCQKNENTAFGFSANLRYNNNEKGIYAGYGAGASHELNYGLLAVGTNAAFKTASLGGVAIGSSSGYENFGYAEFVSIGYYSSKNSTGLSGTTILGYRALENNQNPLAYVTVIGHDNRDIENSTLIIDNGNSDPDKLILGNRENGRIHINGTDANILSSTYEFAVFGDASKNTPGDWAGHSDKRLKKNIIAMNTQNEMNNILQLNAYQYQWKNEANGIKPMKGLMAQEIQEVYPEKVQKDKEGFLTTAYTDYTPLLISAIQEINNKVNQLEKQLTELESIEAKIDHKIKIYQP